MNQPNKNIANWLFICCVMVAIMVMIGGITRLTDSGLSMTGWKPITGWLPPMSETAWQEEFVAYKKSPEYKKINFGMNVQEFKSIFWLEYIHRLLGRITGLVFFIPLIFFIFKKQINKPLAINLSIILALGGFQAFVGWMMVSSGLKDAPHVSQYWLAFHLGMAFVIFTLLFLLALKAKHPQAKNKTLAITNLYKKFAFGLLLLVFIQTIWGAFVAGLDAGLVYNSFPDMNGQIIPDGLNVIEPWYLNPFENVTAVQFTHRVLAYILVIFIIIFCLLKPNTYKSQAITIALPGAIVLQFTLGVLTIINSVPIHLASAHQMGALLLFATLLHINYHLHLAAKK